MRATFTFIFPAWYRLASLTKRKKIPSLEKYNQYRFSSNCVMHKKLQQAFKPLFKTLFVLFLVFTLALSHADGALAASGGRIGGGSFRMP
jgi:hypothetical protein